MSKALTEEKTTGGPPLRLSSNSTLFWRVFAPTFGTVFILGFLAIFWLIPEDELYMRYLSIGWARGIVTAAFLIWALFIWRVLWPLRRLDQDAEHVYITNYWVTVRYPLSDVEGIEMPEKKWPKFAYLNLKAAGRFGQRIRFIPSTNLSKSNIPLLPASEG